MVFLLVSPPCAATDRELCLRFKQATLHFYKVTAVWSYGCNWAIDVPHLGLNVGSEWLGIQCVDLRMSGCSLELFYSKCLPPLKSLPLLGEGVTIGWEVVLCIGCPNSFLAWVLQYCSNERQSFSQLTEYPIETEKVNLFIVVSRSHLVDKNILNRSTHSTYNTGVPLQERRTTI